VETAAPARERLTKYSLRRMRRRKNEKKKRRDAEARKSWGYIKGRRFHPEGTENTEDC